VRLHVYRLYFVYNSGRLLATTGGERHGVQLLPIILATKSQMGLFTLITAPALWNSLPPDLCQFQSQTISSQPNLNSPVFSLSRSTVSKNSKVKTHLLSFFSFL
jgi:hypothetical protein